MKQQIKDDDTAQKKLKAMTNTLSLSENWDEFFSSICERKHSFLFTKPILLLLKKNNIYVSFVSELTLHFILYPHYKVTFNTILSLPHHCNPMQTDAGCCD